MQCRGPDWGGQQHPTAHAQPERGRRRKRKRRQLNAAQTCCLSGKHLVDTCLHLITWRSFSENTWRRITDRSIGLMKRPSIIDPDCRRSAGARTSSDHLQVEETLMHPLHHTLKTYCLKFLVHSCSFCVFYFSLFSIL